MSVSRSLPMAGEVMRNGIAICMARKPAWLGEGSIVLCVKISNGEYVTWFENEDGDTFHGRYYLDLEGAVKSFEERS